jgi:O-acetyl-ADP-ribose deacetylase (regulator of RNase III)
MNQVTLYSAFFSLLLGLAVYIWVSNRQEAANFYTTIQICWLLIALFPVLLIFSFFPDSAMSGTVKGVSIGGAFGAFSLVWWFGTTQSLKARGMDEKLRLLRTDLDEKTVHLNELKAAVQSSGASVLSVPISTAQKIIYCLRSDRQRRVGLITGDIRDVHGVDVWVNSENTNMQMARFYESSISGIIRYCGAQRDAVGYVSNDVIANELQRVMRNETHVQPGTVLVTSSGMLQQSNAVKKIFHVASVQGEVGYGYKPVSDIARCVKNCLDKANANEFKGFGLSSILFPLMGAGRAHGDLGETAQKLIQTAIAYQENTSSSTVQDIYFLVWTNVELEVCQRILQASDLLKVENA